MKIFGIKPLNQRKRTKRQGCDVKRNMQVICTIRDDRKEWKDRQEAYCLLEYRPLLDRIKRNIRKTNFVILSFIVILGLGAVHQAQEHPSSFPKPKTVVILSMRFCRHFFHFRWKRMTTKRNKRWKNIP